MTITFQSPVLFVRDIAASGRFYQELLGQKVEVDEGLSLIFEGGFALWQADHAFHGRPARTARVAERHQLPSPRRT